MNTENYKQDYKINLVRQHQLCESNFLRLLQLLPNLTHQDHHHFQVDFGRHQRVDVYFNVKQRAPYTTHLCIRIDADWGAMLPAPELEVRLYQDVRMAEVIFSKRSDQLDPLYTYPNPKMHQPNEKELCNQFLAELLRYCLKGGIISDTISFSDKF